MLKRLSGTFSQSTDQLLLPPISPGGFLPSSGSAPSSPQAYLTRSTRGGTHSPSNSFSSPQAYPFPPTPSASTSKPITLDRSTLHKSLQALSNLLVALDELRSASLIYSKAEKKVSKGLKELSTCWGDKVSKDMRDSTIGESILTSLLYTRWLSVEGAQLTRCWRVPECTIRWEKSIRNLRKSFNQTTKQSTSSLASTSKRLLYVRLYLTISSRFSRLIGKKESDVQKEEKIFDDSMSTLDAKVSKATSSYNKYASKSSHNPHGTAQLDSLTASHSAYIQTLQSLQSQANLLQVSYGEQIALKRESVGREVARSVTGLAEKSWRNRVEGTRRGGECVGKVLAKGVWISEGMENVGEYERQGMALRGGRYEQETETEEETGLRERGTTPQPRSQSQNQVKEETSPRLESSKTLRGPRAPSTSTTDTRHSGSGLASNSTRSHDLPPTPRPLSRPAPQPSPFLTRAASPQASARDPSPQASRRPSIEEQAPTNSNEIGGGRTLPRGWYLDPSFANHLDENETELARTSMETQQHRQFDSTQPGDFARLADQDSTPRPPPTERRQTYEALSNRRQGENAILRKPTPRYGSAPASNEVPGAFPDQPDEFGRTSRGDEQREGEGRESFVRRMSQKYGAVAEPLRESRQVSVSTSRLARQAQS